MGSSSVSQGWDWSYRKPPLGGVAYIASLVRSNLGGAATPPYHDLVGRTCWPAVISCERAKRCSQPARPLTPTLSCSLLLPSARQRLGDNLTS